MLVQLKRVRVRLLPDQSVAVLIDLRLVVVIVLVLRVLDYHPVNLLIEEQPECVVLVVDSLVLDVHWPGVRGEWLLHVERLRNFAHPALQTKRSPVTRRVVASS